MGTAGWRRGTWEELPEESQAGTRDEGGTTRGTAGIQKGKININKVNEKIHVSKVKYCVLESLCYTNIYQGLVKNDSIQNAVCGELL